MAACATSIALICVSRTWEGIFIGKDGLATNVASESDNDLVPEYS